MKESFYLIRKLSFDHYYSKFITNKTNKMYVFLEVKISKLTTETLEKGVKYVQS